MEATTVVFESVELNINFEHGTPEKQTREHPGSGIEISISEIFFNGADVTDIYYSLGKESDLESIIREDYE